MSACDIKVMVVDDSVFFRKVLADLLEEFEGFTVSGAASSGDIALKKAKLSPPDLVTLDVEMPGLCGLDTLKALHALLPGITVVMISSVTKSGAKATIEALEYGAFDFIQKPDLDTPEANEKQLRGELKRVLNVIQNKKLIASGGGSISTGVEYNKKINHVAKESTETILKRIHAKQHHKIDIIVIGISTGGPAALPVLLKRLSTKVNVPILIVQHMPPLFVQELVGSLNKKTDFTVVAGESYQPLKANHVYIAPGGTQMKLSKLPGDKTPCLMITDDEAENYCKPSVDYLFRSVSNYYGENVVALIMTGMGRDGVEGLRLLKEKHATIFAQDKDSSVVYGMAMEAVKADVVDEILPLELLSKAVEDRVGVRV